MWFVRPVGYPWQSTSRHRIVPFIVYCIYSYKPAWDIARFWKGAALQFQRIITLTQCRFHAWRQAGGKRDSLGPDVFSEPRSRDFSEENRIIGKSARFQFISAKLAFLSWISYARPIWLIDSLHWGLFSSLLRPVPEFPLICIYMTLFVTQRPPPEAYLVLSVVAYIFHIALSEFFFILLYFTLLYFLFTLS